ncbi:MAG: hypothetical protein KBT09_09570 [Bacteroidales bacterium]|nr:hypothetical protein [Candidatus Sodaliphilus fimicaballi]
MDNKKIETYKDLAISAGLLIMLVMAVMPLLNINEEWMRWVYAAGAALVLVVRLTQRYKGKNLRIRRLYVMQVMAAVMFCLSAFLTYYSTGTTDWIAFLMAGSVLQIYASFVIDKEKEKEQKASKNE